MLGISRTRLWRRLVGVFLLATLPPVLGAGWWTASSLEAHARETAFARRKAMAELARDLTADFVARSRGKLLTVSRLLAARLAERGTGKGSRKPSKSAILPELDRLVEPADLYLELQYYGAHEKRPLDDRLWPADMVAQIATKEVQRAQQRIPDFDRRQQALFVENMKSGLVQSPLQTQLLNVEPRRRTHFGFATVPMSAPVLSDESSLGAVVGYLDLRRLTELLTPLSQSGYRVRVLDVDGSDLANVGTVTGKTLPASARMAAPAWTVLVNEPLDSMLTTVSTARARAKMWTAVAIVLAVLLSLLVAAWIVRPIATLTKTARTLEAGDLSARAALERTDEIGTLGSALDRMAAALEQLDAAKSEFIGTVSHELRTPLTSIRLSLGNLLDGLVGPLNADQERSLTRIREDVARLDRMVRDTLELARIDAGVDEPDLQRCELSPLVARAIDSVSALAAKRAIELRAEGDGHATADPDLLQRIVLNLLDNAIKFAPEGSQVTVSLGVGQLVIRDQGPGFDLERPFDAFAQGQRDDAGDDAGAGTNNPGVGLGLSIVERLVGRCGGSIRIHNDGGAVVTIDLQASA